MAQDQIAKLMAIAGQTSNDALADPLATSAKTDISEQLAAVTGASSIKDALAKDALSKDILAKDGPLKNPSPRDVMPTLSAAPPLLLDRGTDQRGNDQRNLEARTLEAPTRDPLPRDALTRETPARRVARRRPAGPVRGKIAANDDVPSIGGLIYALEQKPSSKIFRLTAIASSVWALIGISFGMLTLAPDWSEGASLGTLLLNPVTFYTAAAILIPIAVFWLLALLNWHIASLALKSSTMTEVAIRLAEPDRAAEQSIASLGQAVRRQVSFMNDAVSRALGRAGELEALVHNQVADLERSYEQNERRIRGLIQELTGERHALLNTSTSVTDTLKSLGTEIPMLIEKLSTQQVTLATIIKGAGENLATLEGSLATSTGRFENVLGQRTHDLQAVLEDYTVAFSTALGTRTEQMRTAFDGYMHTLDTTLGNRTENLQTVFEEYARALDTTLSNRAQALDMQLIERTRSLDDAFQQRLELFDAQIVRSTSAIDSAVSEKAELLTNALEIHARTFRDTIARQAVDLDDSVVNGINAVRRTSENITRQTMKAIEGLSNQSSVLQNVAENLFSQIHGVTDRFENQGQQILRAANVLDDANVRIDTTLQTRHADLSRTLDRLSGKADEFGRTLEGYSTNIEGSMSGIELRARALTDELRTTTEAKSRALIGELERVKSQTEAESERSLTELRNRFQTVSGDLSSEFESLTSRLASATDETRLRAAQAAETLAREHARIREEAAHLPTTTRETADSMRRALQDQMRALDQLSQISSRTRSERDVMLPDGGATALSSGLLSPRSSAQSSAQAGRAALAPPMSEPQPTQARGGRAPASAPLTDGRDGWSLGDLLARASHDEYGSQARADTAQSDGPNAGRAAKPSANQPNAYASSNDGSRANMQPFRLDLPMISKAIDAATATNIWARIRAGQRNVMVRSIYTPEARTAFDMISERLKDDREVGQNVMRFLSDFEHVVKDADAQDPSGRMASTHLVSDTGRVYLFLAHAAGRIA